MSQYLIAVYNGPDTRSRPAEQMTEIVAAVDEVNQRAIGAGSFVLPAACTTRAPPRPWIHAAASRSSATVRTLKARNTLEASGSSGARPGCGSGLCSGGLAGLP